MTHRQRGTRIVERSQAETRSRPNLSIRVAAARGQCHRPAESELKSQYSPLFGYNHIAVSHEELHDSQTFEVHQLGNNWLPERVVTGRIRQLAEQRSLVECEVKKAERYFPVFEYAAAGILIAAWITTVNGSAIKKMVMLLWALLAIVTAGVLWLRRRSRQRRDPLIERVQRVLQG
ncbi:MAG: hypothetical protein F4X02_01865 [Chloroflexi bacterium]|nr:hypothetical protein [Chloroflexota bacterium]